MKAVKLIRATSKNYTYSLVVVDGFKSNRVVCKLGSLDCFNFFLTFNIFRLVYWLSIGGNVRWFGTVEKALFFYGLFNTEIFISLFLEFFLKSKRKKKKSGA